MKKNRKLWIWIGVVLVIALVALAGWYFLVLPSGSLSTGLTTAWNSLVDPAANDTSGVLKVSGTVENTVLSVAPEIGGKILEVDFDEGDVVKAGSVLVHLDDGTLKIQRTIAVSNLETAKLSLSQLSSIQEIATLEKTIAQDQQDIDDAQLVLDTQMYFINNKNAIQNAEATLYLARQKLNDAQLVYDKVKYNNRLDETDKARAYQKVYAAKQAYDYALAILDLYTGVPNPHYVDMKTANLALAQARLAEDQAYLDALNGGTIPANATGTGIAKLQQARIAVQVAQAKLDYLDDQISRMTITAPVDGVVMTRSADPGNVVSAGTQLLSLARLNNLTITVFIPRDEYGKIGLGQTATVSVDSYPGETFSAKVVHISDQPQFLIRTTHSESMDKLTIYAVQLELSDTADNLKPGMPADVSFDLE
jgi:HlyD family secretion protein